MLRNMIKKWYRKANSENKVLAAYCSQSMNAVKTSRIIEAIEFSLNSTIKEEDIEELNLVSSWIAINVKDPRKAKALISYRTVMTMERGDLVTFRSITNKSPDHVHIQIVATAPRTIRCTSPLTTEAEITSILKNIWEDRAKIEVSPTANIDFVFTAKVTFKRNCRKTFPAKCRGIS